MNKSSLAGTDRIELMQTFVRIVEAGSLSAAAARLETSQPTISRRLQALEKLLGLKLVQRTTHVMKLTEDGERCWRAGRGSRTICAASPRSRRACCACWLRTPLVRTR